MGWLKKTDFCHLLVLQTGTPKSGGRDAPLLAEESRGRCWWKDERYWNWFCVVVCNILFAQIWRGTMLLEGVKIPFYTRSNVSAFLCHFFIIDFLFKTHLSCHCNLSNYFFSRIIVTAHFFSSFQGTTLHSTRYLLFLFLHWSICPILSFPRFHEMLCNFIFKLFLLDFVAWTHPLSSLLMFQRHFTPLSVFLSFSSLFIYYWSFFFQSTTGILSFINIPISFFFHKQHSTPHSNLVLLCFSRFFFFN